MMGKSFKQSETERFFAAVNGSIGWAFTIVGWLILLLLLLAAAVAVMIFFNINPG